MTNHLDLNTTRPAGLARDDQRCLKSGVVHKQLNAGRKGTMPGRKMTEYPQLQPCTYYLWRRVFHCRLGSVYPQLRVNHHHSSNPASWLRKLLWQPIKRHGRKAARRPCYILSYHSLTPVSATKPCSFAGCSTLAHPSDLLVDTHPLRRSTGSKVDHARLSVVPNGTSGIVVAVLVG